MNQITGSKAAGRKLTSMLELGNSVSWHTAMERMTGNAGMDSSAYREYFKPLENWLVKENKKNGVEVGWILDDVEEKYCLPVKD